MSFEEFCITGSEYNSKNEDFSSTVNEVEQFSQLLHKNYNFTLNTKKVVNLN